MIDIKICINNFNQYVKKFDFKNKMISNKFHHTYRVMELAHDIAVSLKLEESDILVAEVCGLLHDIARFRQATKYKTFIDTNSFDHGDMGYQILLENDFINEFTNDKEIQRIVLLSTKYHNKHDVPCNLTERESLFINITRDADKLDIMREQNNSINDEKLILKDENLNSIYHNELVINNNCTSDIDSILRSISFIFDINFNYSLNLSKPIIMKKLDLLETNINDNRIIKLKEYIINYYKEENIC